MRNQHTSFKRPDRLAAAPRKNPSSIGAIIVIGTPDGLRRLTISRAKLDASLLANLERLGVDRYEDDVWGHGRG